MNLAEKQVELTAQLAALKNGQDRLAFLVEQAQKRPPLAPEFRADENLIPGCLAKLWFVAAIPRRQMFLSTAIPIRSSSRPLPDCSANFTAATRRRKFSRTIPEFLAPLGITQHLTPNRRNALAKVWERIRQFAEA